jgi:hypothetical protein
MNLLLFELTIGIDSGVVSGPTRENFSAALARRDRLVRKLHGLDYAGLGIHTLWTTPTPCLYLRALFGCQR